MGSHILVRQLYIESLPRCFIPPTPNVIRLISIHKRQAGLPQKQTQPWYVSKAVRVYLQLPINIISLGMEYEQNGLCSETNTQHSYRKIGYS